MPTGYEVETYRNIAVIAKAVRQIAKIMEKPEKDTREVALAAFRYGVQQGHSIGLSPQQHEAAFERFYERYQAGGDDEKGAEG